MTPQSLEDLYIHELRDLFSAESQLVEALPKMVEKATHEELRSALQKHLEETRVHRERIARIFENRGVSPSGETCEAMKGLVREANNFVKEAKSLLGHDAPESVLDAGLIAQAQRVEHYEISAYGTACTYAETLGHDDEYRLLSATLSEEKVADGKLNEIAKRLVNPAAASVTH
jgi:ferritin-like metal-binding protein YciE